MRAIIEDQVIAESEDILSVGGYVYFPSSAVKLDRLERAAKTPSDHACPHGVQFYDAVIGDARFERAAWNYESPRPSMAQVTDRFGFWKDVKIV